MFYESNVGLLLKLLELLVGFQVLMSFVCRALRRIIQWDDCRWRAAKSATAMWKVSEQPLLREQLLLVVLLFTDKSITLVALSVLLLRFVLATLRNIFVFFGWKCSFCFVCAVICKTVKTAGNIEQLDLSGCSLTWRSADAIAAVIKVRKRTLRNFSNSNFQLLLSHYKLNWSSYTLKWVMESECSFEWRALSTSNDVCNLRVTSSDGLLFSKAALLSSPNRSAVLLGNLFRKDSPFFPVHRSVS